jgi:hypothetical protein
MCDNREEVSPVLQLQQPPSRVPCGYDMRREAKPLEAIADPVCTLQVQHWNKS